VVVVGRERMLGYEGRFEKRAITLYDYTLDRGDVGAAAGAAPIVPITNFAARPLEVPAGDEPLALAAAHFVVCVERGGGPVSSGARSLRVVEVLEAAHRAATQGGRTG